jgi:hypothetical protein
VSGILRQSLVLPEDFVIAEQPNVSNADNQSPKKVEECSNRVSLGGGMIESPEFLKTYGGNRVYGSVDNLLDADEKKLGRDFKEFLRFSLSRGELAKFRNSQRSGDAEHSKSPRSNLTINKSHCQPQAQTQTPVGRQTLSQLVESTENKKYLGVNGPADHWRQNLFKKSQTLNYRTNYNNNTTQNISIIPNVNASN